MQNFNFLENFQKKYKFPKLTNLHTFLFLRKCINLRKFPKKVYKFHKYFFLINKSSMHPLCKQISQEKCCKRQIGQHDRIFDGDANYLLKND